MITQLLQKIKLKRSFFSCLLFLLPASYLQAAVNLKGYINNLWGYSNTVIYQVRGHDDKYISNKDLFQLKVANYVNVPEAISFFFTVCQKLNQDLKKHYITFKNIEISSTSLSILLAHAFLLRQYDEKSVLEDIIKNLKEIKNNKQTAYDLLLQWNNLAHTILEQYSSREKLVKELDSNKNYNKWDEWENENAKQFINQWKEVFKNDDVKITPNILLLASSTHDLIFSYFLDLGSQQHQADQLYWLNGCFFSKSTTFLTLFLAKHYTKPDDEPISNGRDKDMIFKAIGIDPKKEINILEKNNIDDMEDVIFVGRDSYSAFPTAFVVACMYSEKDALELLNKIEKAPEKDVVDYLNTTLEDYKLPDNDNYENECRKNALMAALYVKEPGKSPLKYELLKKLLAYKDLIVEVTHIEYFEKKVFSIRNNDKQVEEIMTILRLKYQAGRKVAEEQQRKKIISLQSKLKTLEDNNEEKIDEANEKLSEVSKEAEKLTEQNQKLKNTIEENKTKITDLENAALSLESLQKEINELKSKYNKQNNQLNQLKHSKDNLVQTQQGEIKSLESDGKKKDVMINKLSEEVASQDSQLNILTGKVDQAKKLVKDREKKIMDQEKLNSDKEKEVSNQKKLVENKDNQINTLKGNHANKLQEERVKYQNLLISTSKEGDGKNNLANDLKDVTTKNGQLSSELEGVKSKLKTVQTNNDELNKQLNRVQNQLKKAHDTNDELNNKLVTAKNKLNEDQPKGSGNSQVKDDDLQKANEEKRNLEIELQKVANKKNKLNSNLQHVQVQLQKKEDKGGSTQTDDKLAKKKQKLTEQLNKKATKISKLKESINLQKGQYNNIEKEKKKRLEKIDTMKREAQQNDDNKTNKINGLEEKIKEHKTTIDTLQKEKKKLESSSKITLGQSAGWIFSVVLLSIVSLQAWYAIKIRKKLADAIDL